MEQTPGRKNKIKRKTVMIFKSHRMTMSGRQKKKSRATSQAVWVGEVEMVWGTPISKESMEWFSLHLETKLQTDHGGRLTQEAAVAVTKRDRAMQRHVSRKGLQMRAADVAWAWVAQKIRDGQAVGRVFRPAIGKLEQHED